MNNNSARVDPASRHARDSAAGGLAGMCPLSRKRLLPARRLLLTMAAALLVSAPSLRAADPAAAQPPDRLEKRPPPGEPKQPVPPAEKKAAEKAVEPVGPAEDPAKLRERIA